MEGNTSKKFRSIGKSKNQIPAISGRAESKVISSSKKKRPKEVIVTGNNRRVIQTGSAKKHGRGEPDHFPMKRLSIRKNNHQNPGSNLTGPIPSPRSNNAKEPRNGKSPQASISPKNCSRLECKTSEIFDQTQKESNLLPNKEHLTDVEFSSLERVSEESKQALINISKYRYLTQVQHATLATIMDGQDVLAKAKTGTGKTIAFLLPSVEKIATNQKDGNVQRNQISLLVLSPTRELALQIQKEAKDLTTYHKILTQCVIGGRNIETEKKNLSRQNIGILVATPGRLLDHLKSNNADLANRLSNVQCVALDEADRLLDMGFRPDLEKIFSFLPTQRQTLLFSATVPDSLRKIKHFAFPKDYVFIDTVGKIDADTHQAVPQDYVVCQTQEHVRALEQILSVHVEEQENLQQGFKVIVFFPTANMAGFMAKLFQLANFPVLEMHSRKSQTQRVKISETFRASENIMLFSSDVSARGMDYPGVTLVVQVGLTNREQYIHRLGRTARAGQNGKGMLLISHLEARVLIRELKGLPLEAKNIPHLSSRPPSTDSVLRNIESNEQLKQSAEKAYQAFLGFYNSNLKRLSLSKEQLVQLGAEYSTAIGLSAPPKLFKKTLKKMNLLGTPGLEFAPNPRPPIKRT